LSVSAHLIILHQLKTADGQTVNMEESLPPIKDKNDKRVSYGDVKNEK
jgi:hypothetical protein